MEQIKQLKYFQLAQDLREQILTGRIQPIECPAYGHRCTPERPLGAPMVSAEGACAAYFQYRAPEGNA